jgi:hypothetical protein
MFIDPSFWRLHHHFRHFSGNVFFLFFFCHHFGSGSGVGCGYHVVHRHHFGSGSGVGHDYHVGQRRHLGVGSGVGRDYYFGFGSVQKCIHHRVVGVDFGAGFGFRHDGLF